MHPFLAELQPFGQTLLKVKTELLSEELKRYDVFPWVMQLAILYFGVPLQAAALLLVTHSD